MKLLKYLFPISILIFLLYLSLTSPFIEIGGMIKISFLGVVDLGLHPQTITSILSFLEIQNQLFLYYFIILTIIIFPIICLALTTVSFLCFLPLTIRKVSLFVVQTFLPLTMLPTFLISLLIVCISLSKTEGLEVHLKTGFFCLFFFFLLLSILAKKQVLSLQNCN